MRKEDLAFFTCGPVTFFGSLIHEYIVKNGYPPDELIMHPEVYRDLMIESNAMDYIDVGNEGNHLFMGVKIIVSILATDGLYFRKHAEKLNGKEQK